MNSSDYLEVRCPVCNKLILLQKNITGDQKLKCYKCKFHFEMKDGIISAVKMSENIIRNARFVK